MIQNIVDGVRINDAFGSKDIGNLIDLKFSVNDNGKPESNSILIQAQQIIAAYKEGQTLPYGDH
ncbi:MAG: hypothetical protein RL358_1299 [Pseudomonadota bacterium]